MMYLNYFCATAIHTSLDLTETYDVFKFFN